MGATGLFPNINIVKNYFPKIISALVFSFYFSSSAISQITISTNQFISSALQDASVMSHQEQVDFLKNTDYNLPVARQLEARTETDEMDYGRQEYLMRFRFNPHQERKAHKNIHLSKIQLQEIENRLFLEEALMDRYFFIIKYNSLSKEINMTEQQKAVADDMLHVLKRKATNNASFDLNDLLTTENKVHELELEIMEKNGELELLNKTLRETVGTKRTYISLDTARILAISELRNKIKQLPDTPDANPLFLKRQLNIEQNNLDYAYEQTRNGWKIDYIQLKYAKRNNLSFGRELSIGAGVEIPLKSGGKLDKNDYLLDQIELENRLELQRAALNEQLEKTRQELEQKFLQYDLANQQLSNSQAQYSFKNYPNHSNADPVLLLNIKSNILKRKNILQKIEEDIYTLYLEWIELSGVAIEMPLKNYLTANWLIIK